MPRRAVNHTTPDSATTVQQLEASARRILAADHSRNSLDGRDDEALAKMPVMGPTCSGLSRMRFNNPSRGDHDVDASM